MTLSTKLWSYHLVGSVVIFIVLEIDRVDIVTATFVGKKRIRKQSTKSGTKAPSKNKLDAREARPAKSPGVVNSMAACNPDD